MRLLLSITLVGALAAPAFSQTRVVDGDTLIINNERVRIWGLDCAEHFEEAGRKATHALRALLDGNRVLIAERKGKDRYGRTVAQVLVQRTSRAEFFTFDIACYLIANGYCVEYTYYSKGFYNRCKP